jgi:hypothetical protein
VCLLIFQAYTRIDETHGPRSKIPSKKSRQAALRRGGITSGVKGLITSLLTNLLIIFTNRENRKYLGGKHSYSTDV